MTGARGNLAGQTVYKFRYDLQTRKKDSMSSSMYALARIDWLTACRPSGSALVQIRVWLAWLPSRTASYCWPELIETTSVCHR